MRLVSLECIMPPPELEAREDFVIKRRNTTDPEVFAHRSPPVPTAFEIVLRKKIFLVRKLYGLVHARQGVAADQSGQPQQSPREATGFAAVWTIWNSSAPRNIRSALSWANLDRISRGVP
jgi:hypothetical protein